jgi:hypothetical protein
MERVLLAITLANGQTVHAQPRPEDDEQLAQLLGGGSTIELTSSNDDLEGHAFSADVTVDVEGHAITLRLPTPTDAAAVRRALAVGVVSAAIVGAGAVAALHPPASTPTSFEQAPERVQTQAVPGPAIRAQQDEMRRDAAQQEVVRQQMLKSVPLDADNPAIPAQALRAEQAEMQREQELESVQRAQTLQAIPADADNPDVPAQAKHAGTD